MFLDIIIILVLPLLRPIIVLLILTICPVKVDSNELHRWDIDLELEVLDDEEDEEHMVVAVNAEERREQEEIFEFILGLPSSCFNLIKKLAYF